MLIHFNMTQMKSNPSPTALLQLIETVHRLRAPDGCPWDRAQTHQSLRQYLIEEAYEVIDVLDQINSPEDLKIPKIRDSFREELGDLFMQVLLHSEMTHEAGAFNIHDVAQGLNDKLIRRHPHVFGEVKADSVESALKNWEKEKSKEKASDLNSSILEGVPRNLPALQRAARVLEKVTKVGFQWHDMHGPLEKVDEELAELKLEILKLDQLTQTPQTSESSELEKALKKRVESELGDLFFTLCNISYLMKISPEDSLRGTLSRFQNRFRHVESRLKEQGKTPEQSSLVEMDQFWNEAKKIEKAEVWGLTGGIAAGKSTVGQYFIQLGIPVIDADQITRDLLQKDSPAYSDLIHRFGTLERNQLREIVFSDLTAKKDLEQILHPLIQMESRKRIQTLALKHPIIIYEAALLVETGRYQDLAGLIVVEASEEIRIQRLLSRKTATPELARKMINSQISDLEREKHADLILENSGTLEDLHTKVEEFVFKKGWNSHT